MLAALVLAAVIDCDAYASYEIRQPYDANADAVELAEKFANADGVTRDLGAAIHLVCSAESLSAPERDGMIGHLAKMLSGETTAPLDFCDHINGGHGAYVCAVRNDKISQAAMRAWFASHAPANAVDALVERASEYIEKEALAQAEVNRGGTIYETVMIYARIEAREKYIAMMDRVLPLLTCERARSAETRE